MAVSGVGSSKSIYGNRNVITGLASGLDTESMIENAISAYKSKITALTQKRTKTEWRQESYRSIIDKMSVFADKYTSYRSSNNLMSASFFDQAVKTTAKGANSSKVTASGRGTNDVQVNRIKQLATAATYRLSGSAIDKQTSGILTDPGVTMKETFNLAGERPISTISGTMTLTYGGSNAESKLYVEFDQEKFFNSPQELADEINKQLKTQTVNIGSKSYTGQELLDNITQAKVDGGGNIFFTDPKNNNIYISGASDDIMENLLGVEELSNESGEQLKTFNAANVSFLQTMQKNIDYLSSGSITLTLDGMAKTIQLPGAQEIIDKLRESGEVDSGFIQDIRNGNEISSREDRQRRDDAFVAALQDKIDGAFGKGKFTVEDVADDRDTDALKSGVQLKFSAAQGSTFSVTSTRASALGFGSAENATSYLNVNKTLGDLLGEDLFDPEKEGAFEPAWKPMRDANGNILKNYDGTIIPEMKDGKPVYETDENGNTLYSFKVNGVEVGQFSKDTTLGTVINVINGTSEAGVRASYSKTTNELLFTARDTGEGSKISMDSPLAQKLFGAPGTYDAPEGSTYTAGKDAIFSVSINGTELKDLRRASNSVEFDGLTLNLKGTFGYETNEDGSVKYSQVTNEKGQLEFSYNGDKKLYAQEEKAADGSVRYALYNENGSRYQYSSTAGVTGEIYGKITDGKLTFEMVRDDNGETVSAYGRLTEKGSLWFSISDKDAVDFKAVMSEKAAETTTEPITFETTSDADKIVEAVKAMIDDYNEMATEIKKAYSTLPLQRSNKQYYEPLTEEDQEDMTESDINAWQEKAKTGVLFGDNDLRTLYSRLTSAISMTGEHGAALRAAGITVSYSNGLSTLSFNEDKFRDALANDPDSVRDAFISSTENGAKSNGLMQALKQPLDMYGKTVGGKGILVEKAGSVLAPTTLYTNTIQKELDNIDDQIEKWQDKMSDQVDYYTNQFSKLEQLISQMNSQSSYFSQLMGGQ